MKHGDQIGQTTHELYLEELIDGFWEFAEKQALVRPGLLDRTRRSQTRAPVFRSSEAWRNLILPDDLERSIRSEIVAAIPVEERHRYFGSMRSSQALAQSVFGSIAALGKIDLLAGVISDEGPALFSGISSNATITMERRVDTLGEPRPTSIDVWFEAPHRIAVECKLTEPDFGACSRPDLRPGRDPNYHHDHCDGSYTRQRGRATRCSLTEIGVRYWNHIPTVFRWNANSDLQPCPLHGSYQLARTILAACVELDGGCDLDRGHAVVIYDARNPAVAPGGTACEQWDATKRDMRRPELLLSCSWQALVAHLSADPELFWLVGGLKEKYGIVAN